MAGTHIIVDKTPDGACITCVHNELGRVLADKVENEEAMELGDAMVIRDVLFANGFEWSKDFFMKKAED